MRYKLKGCTAYKELLGFQWLLSITNLKIHARARALARQPIIVPRELYYTIIYLVPRHRQNIYLEKLIEPMDEF